MSAIYIPQKRKYAANDPFFEEGNIALRAHWLARDAQDTQDVEMIRQEANLLAEEMNRPIFCELSSCMKHGRPTAFPNIAAYELHYEARHRHVCMVCSKTFPNSHLLQLHIDEFHNVIKQVQRDRGEKVYRCYVEDCQKHFISPKMRRLHLIDKHHYPKHYPFDIAMTGTLSIEERRRARKKQQSALKAKQTTTSTVSDMDVDDLVAGMSRLSIPKSISFGRAKPSLQRNSKQQRKTTTTTTTTTAMEE